MRKFHNTMMSPLGLLLLVVACSNQTGSQLANNDRGGISSGGDQPTSPGSSGSNGASNTTNSASTSDTSPGTIGTTAGSVAAGASSGTSDTSAASSTNFSNNSAILGGLIGAAAAGSVVTNGTTNTVPFVPLCGRVSSSGVSCMITNSQVWNNGLSLPLTFTATLPNATAVSAAAAAKAPAIATGFAPSATTAGDWCAFSASGQTVYLSVTATMTDLEVFIGQNCPAH